jgi:hypothetical protein
MYPTTRPHRLNALNRAVIEGVVARWGVQAGLSPTASPTRLTGSQRTGRSRSGHTRLGVGGQVDFTNPISCGDRLMVKADDEITGNDCAAGGLLSLPASLDRRSG